MNYLFPTDKATDYCLSLIKLFDETNSVFNDCETIDKEKYSLQPLFGLECGQMFGVAVCEDNNGNEIVLKAFSGQFRGLWNVPGFVPPLVNEKDFDEVVKCYDSQIKKLTKEIENCNENEKQSLIEERKSLSNKSLENIYKLYKFYSFDGKEHKLFDETKKAFPPTGTGDCCAPKLLSYAAKNSLKVISMAEFFYGKENKSKTKKHKMFYPPCDEKCGIILPLIMGLKIIYVDDSIIVVNKEAGLLSVPGKVALGTLSDCVVNRIKACYAHCIDQPSVHRLDMDTSGLMVFAFTEYAQKKLSIQFQKREVKKQYIALLRGRVLQKEGVIELPFRLDPEHRPYQVYDPVNGKLGKTIWKLISYETMWRKTSYAQTVTRILFEPLTGRTHQLRLHSASDKGLNMPIVGDRLYGERKEHENRMMLHASMLEFNHPISGERLHFESSPDF